MRMKPVPSSDRLFSKCAQSTILLASSLTPSSSSAGCLRLWSHYALDRPQRVKFSLSLRAIEGIGAPTEAEPQRHRAELEVAAHGIEEIAAIAVRQFVHPVAEDYEGRRARLHLGDVA